MTYKTLLVHVEGKQASDPRLQFAVNLTTELSGARIGIGGCVPAYVDQATFGFVDGALLQAIAEDEQANFQTAETRFHQIARSLGEGAVWRSSRSPPDQVMVGCSAEADLVIASAHSGQYASSVDPGEIVIRSGLPVLTVPPTLTVLGRGPAIVASKNTREARRAVTDALPLLRRADRVTIVQVQESVDDSDPWDGLQGVINRLTRQGVSSHTHTLTSAAEDSAHELLAFAESQSAGLIVAGAYGHSRLREWCFRA